MRPARRPRAVSVPIRSGLGALAALVALLVAPSAGADRVTLKKGPVLRGTVSKTDTEVLVNRYRSTSPAMTYGVTRVPAADVRKIDEEPDPEDVVRRRRDELGAADAVGRVGLARYALSQKMRPEADRLLEEALAIDPKVADGATLYGGLERFDAARRGNPALDPALRASLAAYLRLVDGAARAAEVTRIAAAHGYAPGPERFERAWRSAREPRGYRETVVGTLRSSRHTGASYSIRVPATYDPFTPIPLLVALHDGKGGGKDGRNVVGRGRDADALYAAGAERLGWILACPTAVIAPWSEPANDAWIADVIEEVSLRYHVDLDRVLVVGHGAGADGVWSYATKHARELAGIAASAGSSPGAGFKAIRDARLRVHLYHSEDDSLAGPGATRAAADALLDLGADVTYLELPDRGHSFPPEADAEMLDVLRRARRSDVKRTSAWPASSFARPVTADERRDIGDPLAAYASGPPRR